MSSTLSKTVAVAMSGGVDSSVAAALLKQQEYNVFGLTMHLWDYDGVGGNVAHESSCCSLESMDDARAVCHKLGIPHYVIDLRTEFENFVIHNFIHEYMVGHTPNPCIRCNTEIKWGALLKKAITLGADFLATGHYARIQKSNTSDRYVLLKSKVKEKDQAYALWGLDQQQLSRTLLPLGDLSKIKVRAYAEKLGLKTAGKSESQEICFIPDNNYNRFLKKRLQSKGMQIESGDILDTSGKVLGKHQGYPFYTIGQRKGLGIAVGKPVYVNEIDSVKNRITVGSRDEVLAHGAVAKDMNWISITKPEIGMEIETRIRYNDPGFPASFSSVNNGLVQVEFHELQSAVTPGQSIVFFQEDVVLGGGIIDHAVK